MIYRFADPAYILLLAVVPLLAYLVCHPWTSTGWGTEILFARADPAGRPPAERTLSAHPFRAPDPSR